MTAEPGYCYEQAKGMAQMGYKLVPIGVGKKYPPIQKWQEAATNDRQTITGWFKSQRNGLGWAMGLQPNGMYLVAIDIDGEAGGTEFIRLVSEHPESVDAFKRTVQQVTGSNGAHYVFSTPYEIRNSAKQFADHIDIRGEGGQVLWGPTIHPNGQPYQNVKNPIETPILPAPEWVLERIEEMSRSEPPAAPSVAAPAISLVARGSDDDDSPLTWANEHFSTAEIIARYGWQYLESKGDDEYWVRPGKLMRDGHSAVLHPDGTLVVFTTEVGPAWGICKTSRDGSAKVATPFDVYCIYEHGGNVSAAMRHIRFHEMPAREPRAVVEAAPGSTGQVTPAAMQQPPADLNLPDEFWESRGWLAHIRDAAWHRMLNPTAVLGAVLVRYAASIDPRVQLPEIVGSTGTFDLFVMLVGNPGSGKSTAWSCAKDLMPNLPRKIRDDVPLGTGEGLVEMLYARVNDDGEVTNKKSDERRLHYDGVCVMVNEGKALGEQSARTGSVIIETLCQAWMGETLGQANASEDTFRHVPSKTRRITACIGIQTENAPIVFEGKFRATGLPQRMIALWAHPDYLPDDDDAPDWPGELVMAKPSVIGGLTVFSADAEIVRTVRSERRAVALRQHNLDELDVHLRLAQLKLAGVFAAADGGSHISIEHWALAETVLASHKAMRSTIYSTHQERELARRTTQARRQAETMLVIDDHMDQAKLQKCIKRVRHLLDQQGTWTRGKLFNRVTPGQQQYFDDALEALSLTGDLSVDGDTVTKT